MLHFQHCVQFDIRTAESKVSAFKGLSTAITEVVPSISGTNDRRDELEQRAIFDKYFAGRVFQKEGPWPVQYGFENYRTSTNYTKLFDLVKI